MTNEIEKTFFDTFGIKPSNMCKYAKYGYDGTEGIWYFCAKNQKECWTYPDDTTCKDKMTSYPEITDRILLELICIINQIDLYFYGEYGYFMEYNYEDLKKEVILKCKRLADKNALLETTGEPIKQQVQELFKEG